jgi:hypothetical protein
MSHDQTNDHRETMREILSYAAGGLVAMGIYLGYWWWRNYFGKPSYWD